MGKPDKTKKGFTLIEVITVCVIIAIAAAIAVPNFGNLIKRTQLRNIVQTAQWAEDATMSLTGLQYASPSGNPPIADWSSYEEVGKDNFIYIQKGSPAINIGDVFRAAPANIAVENRTRATSEGLNEFYKRTMNDLQPPTWRNTLTFEDLVTCSIYFYRDPAILDLNTPSITAGSFVRYNFAYSEYYMLDGNRQFAIYHGIRFHEENAQPGAVANTPVADPGWHVYLYDSGTLTYFGSL